MKNKFIFLWILWTLFGAFLSYLISISDSGTNTITLIGRALSLSPLIGLVLTFGSPKGASQFHHWLRTNNHSIYLVVGGISLLFVIPGLLVGNFDPYSTLIFAFIVAAVFGLLKQSQADSFTLHWADVALWLLLWIPFDLRWYLKMETSLDYTWWSIAISVIAVIGWHGYRGADIGFRLVPKLKDISVALLALLGIMMLVVPPGLLSGFLTFSNPDSFDFPMLAAHFIGLFLTVALPEELFFRGILLRGLEKVFAKKWVPLVISSLAFGLMHWNNVDTLSTQIIYVFLATIAGLGYGWAYRKSGNNLLAAILVHTLVDWVWKLFFAG